MASSESNDDLLRDLARAPDAASGSTPRARFADDGVTVGEAVRLADGVLLAERFEVLGVIGRGGMGEVYRAHDRRLGREVAIKLLTRSDTDRQQRLEREARATSAIRHPHVLAVYDTGVHEGAPYLVLELVEGGTLRHRIAAGPVPVAAALDTVREIALGLGAAHAAGVIHRDLKPENVLLTPDGAARIVDFGLAKLTGALRPDEASLTNEGVVLGTTTYMAPEQARGEAVDHRADLFSLGSILVELVTGRPPFARASTADTLSAILRDAPDLSRLPVEVAAIAERCLAKAPADRFQSAGDLAFALAQVDVGQRGSGAGAAPPPPANRRRGIFSSLAVIAVVLISVAAFTRRPGAVSATATAATADFVRLTFRRGTVHAARYAPDHAAIVHSAAWDDRPGELFVTEPGLFDARPLGLRGELLAVSASGQVAIKSEIERRSAWGFWRVGRLSRVPLHGGEPRELAEHVSEADLGSDGTVAATLMVGDRWSIEWPLGSRVRDSNGWLGEPRLSPDGARLAFVEHDLPEDDGGAVWLLDRSGRATRLTARYLSLQGLCWSATGDRLLFTAAETGASRALRSVSSAGGDERVHYRAPSSLRVLDVAPDGRLLLVRDDNRVRMVAVEPDGAQRDLSWLDGSAVQGFSSDDSQLAFTESWDGAGPDYGIYLRPWTGGAAVRVAEGTIGEPSPTRGELLAPRGEPGGRRSLWRVPIGAGDPRRIDIGGFDLGWMRWFPDGEQVLLVTLDGGLAIADGRDAPRLLPVRTRDIFHVAVAPDGRHIAYLDVEGAAILDLTDGSHHPIAGAQAGEVPLAFDRSSSSVYLTRASMPPALLIRVDLASGLRRLRELGPADSAGVQSVIRIAVSHDDGKVAFSYLQTLSTLYQARGLPIR